ncbi:TOMM precursor leader peptide-binding protein [Glaciibacter psychrotolerans]|uniref:Bacteriocin biosynthesis cyclodehydratase domain-containing protein n=1 Tax=Glaciibacter psychrotolerans TaxID=670054 RepID=A0A7Z0EEW4_9MICO|nr:TOMM precursor leader peptide-binding protein [Leifsonia psychrotolerans]NYJ19709.1 bacteriocin biosynthesis cyclodehydratase domain-containing protein [Leifsonia psychrotolerans]
MVIRLNPRYPLVWRTPTSIQCGIDQPLAVIPVVGVALERVLSLLRSGVPRSAVVMMSRECGATDAELAALLRALRPVLEVTGEDRPGAVGSSLPVPTPPTLRVCVDGVGPTAALITRCLADLGYGVDHILPDDDAAHSATPKKRPGSGPALAVLVAHYALDPRRHAHWLRRDIPHLPVVFSDQEVRIGPLVEPGAGPCLRCIELHRVESDSAWPAIAYQLAGQTAPTETARSSLDVACRVAGLVQDRLHRGRSELTATSLGFDPATARLTRYAHRSHEQCGCRALSENATVRAGRADRDPMPTS